MLLRCHDEDLPREGCRSERDGASKRNAHACAARETRHAVAPKRITSRDPHIDVLRSCTRDEPIAAVANARGVVGAGRTTDRSRALTYHVT